MSVPAVSHFEQHFLFSNRIVRFIMGLNPNIKLYDQLIRNFLIFAWVFPIIIYQLYQVHDTKKDFLSSCFILQVSVITFGVLCTYCVTNIQFETMQHLIAYIKYDYEHFLNESELKISEKYKKFTKICTFIFIGNCCVFNINITTPSILRVFSHIFGLVENVNLTLPFPVNKISNSGFVYYSLLVYELITIFLVLMICCTIYLIYLIFIQHACTLLSILIFKIRQPFVEQKFIQKKWHSQKNNDELTWIINIINSYTRVAEYVNLINKLSKMIYIIGITLILINIFFNILYILELPIILQSNIKQILECLITVIGTLFIIYINFFFGQTLIDHSNKVFDELCQVPFYILSIKTQKLLLLLIARSIKPCELSIGGVFTASHEIFAGVLQKAFSFAMAYHSLIQ